MGDENLIADATARVGGGPAFVAYIAKAFTDVATKAGFTDDQALTFTCQVLRGTADLLTTTRQDPEHVYCRVTTGGTIEQGILTLQNHHVHDTLLDVFDNAACRARQLGFAERG
ncbi:pyrroline-5-carboxylate reductase dimerization domain-containing protein [Streptomyces sp. T12]|uniref:pyrroline-5-carboxylate reductase dimerization domain-containing protein n=1 Tax=Streptomyces sp. T12 TaxID=477697 RepID=UPI0035A316E0